MTPPLLYQTRMKFELKKWKHNSVPNLHNIYLNINANQVILVDQVFQALQSQFLINPDLNNINVNNFFSASLHQCMMNTAH